MFVELNSLVNSCGKLTLTLFPGKDGQMKICVAPGTAAGKESALSQPLVLVATPAELDAGFVEALGTYEASRNSLSAQVEATTAILKDAEKKQSEKAVKAIKGKPATKSTTNAADTGSTDEDDEDADGGNGDNDSGPVSAPPATSGASIPAVSGTDLSSLL